MKLFVQNCFTRDIPKMQNEMQTPISILEEKIGEILKLLKITFVTYLDWNKSPSVNFKCCSLVINYVGLSRQILGQSVVRSVRECIVQATPKHAFKVFHFATSLQPMSQREIEPGFHWLAVNLSNHSSLKGRLKDL